MGDHVHRLPPNMVQLVLHSIDNMQFTFVSIFTSAVVASALNDYLIKECSPTQLLKERGSDIIHNEDSQKEVVVLK